MYLQEDEEFLGRCLTLQHSVLAGCLVLPDHHTVCSPPDQKQMAAGDAPAAEWPMPVSHIPQEVQADTAAHCSMDRCLLPGNPAKEYASCAAEWGPLQRL